MSPTSRPRFNPRTSAEVSTDPDAIVWGAKAIGSVIGRNERQTFHLLENGALKGARKIGGIWTAKRSSLLGQWEAD
jgi:hypothetical protein